MVVSANNTTYQSEKQKLLARPSLRVRKGARWGERTDREEAPPPPYSPIAGRHEMVLEVDSDTETMSQLSDDSSDAGSDCSTWSTDSASSANSYSTTSTSSLSSPSGFSSTSMYSSYSPEEGFATFVTLTTKVVPLADLDQSQLPPAYSPARCPSCADGYAAAQLGLSCPHNCTPVRSI